MPVKIETFVILDLETTGLPWQENNQTKIIELCALTMSRTEILRARPREHPDAEAFHTFYDPGRPLNPEIVKLTGITDDFLYDIQTFQQGYNDFEDYINSLPRPICIVAHNGNNFDYKILLAEINDAGGRLPNDIYCVDSLPAFRVFEKPEVPTNTAGSSTNRAGSSHLNEWPDLDVSAEDWDEIDGICQQLSDASTGSGSPKNQRQGTSGYLVAEPVQPQQNTWKGKKSYQTNKHHVQTGYMAVEPKAKQMNQGNYHHPRQGNHSDGRKFYNQNNKPQAVTTGYLDINPRPTMGGNPYQQQVNPQGEKKYHNQNARPPVVTCGYYDVQTVCIPSVFVKETRPIHKTPNVPKPKQGKLTTEKRLYNLSALYQRLVKEKPLMAHNASDDCTMLLKCIIVKKNEFLPWADFNCKPINNIKPLVRYYAPRRY